jgi:Ankyrin repeats (3 copies)
MIDYLKRWKDQDIFRCTHEAASSVLEEESNAYLFTLRDETLLLLNVEGYRAEIVTRNIAVLGDGKLEYEGQTFDTPSDVANFLFRRPFINPRRIRQSTHTIGPILANKLATACTWLSADQVERALILASLNESSDALRLCEQLASTDKIKNGLLHTAASVGNSAVVEWLIRQVGVDVNYVIEGRTALWWATVNHHVATAGTILMEGGDSGEGISCQKAALEQGDLATATQITSMLGWPRYPLHRAARNPNPDILEWVYGQFDGDLETLNNKGERPLEVAIRVRNPDTTFLILDLGCVPNEHSLALLPRPTNEMKRGLIREVVQSSALSVASLIEHLNEEAIIYLINIGVLERCDEAIEAAIEQQKALALSYLVPTDPDLLNCLKDLESEAISTMIDGLLHAGRITVLQQLINSVAGLPDLFLPEALNAQCKRYHLRHRAIDDLILNALELAQLTVVQHRVCKFGLR